MFIFTVSIQTTRLISTVSTQCYNYYSVSTLFLQNHIYRCSILSLLQVSLQISLRGDILYHLYKGISTIMLLLLSLHTFLQSEFLEPSLHVSLRSRILQSSLLTSLQSKFVLISLWKIFLRYLCKDILTVTTTSSDPEQLDIMNRLVFFTNEFKINKFYLEFTYF